MAHRARSFLCHDHPPLHELHTAQNATQRLSSLKSEKCLRGGRTGSKLKERTTLASGPLAQQHLRSLKSLRCTCRCLLFGKTACPIGMKAALQSRANLSALSSVGQVQGAVQVADNAGGSACVDGSAQHARYDVHGHAQRHLLRQGVQHLCRVQLSPCSNILPSSNL